ncbi:Gfo/Idh/MocA family protein [Kribbella shirazensis]|uniref:Putative dehydrogenase n=1 Tax=Kribbella shirazensis TaxID=1105143 RepID=A0A7X6A234_9ACTN|nr:Gfo/Idh/MocA family oxidoreductase [Kribbella shirazensis]NIK58877.1 putative dehydrogenase [Kribbella shirazensis]
MKVALLGTGFGQAHAAVYAQRPDVDEVIVFGRTPEKLTMIGEQFGFTTTTDLSSVITDDSMDLIDICLPTRLHADVAVQAMQAGQDVLIELPLAANLGDARRIIEVQQATGRRAFVDMFSRFTPAHQWLRDAVTDRRYGSLMLLESEGRTALLWPGYDLTLRTLALDMMHADLDLVTGLLGRPDTVQVTGIDGPAGRGSAASVLLSYSDAFARLSSSALMPQPYGMRGGWRAVFADGTLEYAMTAGFTGQGQASLTEHTADGERPIELVDISPYAAMIDHVLACLTGDTDNRIEPASALLALELTLDVHERLTQPGSRLDPIREP